MDYTTLATDEAIATTIEGLRGRNIQAEVLNTKEEALQRIKEMIPAGASVMNGTSATLQEIGYIDYLKSGTHGWNNLHEVILEEKDPAKQMALRRSSTASDYYLGSVHAVSESGEMVFGSNTGSQMPHLAYTSPNLILVVGTQKIVPTLTAALERLAKQVVPLENERMLKAYGSGTYLSKILIFQRESEFNKRNITVLFVKESLGF